MHFFFQYFFQLRIFIVFSESILIYAFRESNIVNLIFDLKPFSKLTECHILKVHTNAIKAIDICEQRNLLVSISKFR